MKIKDLCCDEQPREKMLSKGAASLSNAELLAILLRTGDGRNNAVEISRDLLKQGGESLCAVSDMSVERLQCLGGIGPAKALTIAATFELARRWFGEKTGQKRSVRTSEDVFRLMWPKMKGLSHEEFWVMLLNRAGKPVSVEKISTGGITQTTMDQRIVVRRALETSSTAVILVHNHPSGDPRPGDADIECTDMLRNALEPFDIRLLDHVVVGDGNWFSFSDGETGSLRGPFSDAR